MGETMRIYEPTDPSPQRLLEEAKEGSATAFEQLVKPLLPRWHRYATHFAGSHQDAEEIVQETLIAAFRSLDRFRADASLSTWLWRILLNRCTDHVRHSSRRGGAHIPFDELGYEPSDEDRCRRYADLYEAINNLKPKDRVGLILYYFEGQSVVEIAETLDVPTGTVKARLARSRKKLEKLLRPGNQTDDPDA